ncbi:MAG: hypothetical protein PHG16_12505 [Lachnospiraceae bacterium]|nr:hypothetical protein [Lachnospiraceae bacterium]
MDIMLAAIIFFTDFGVLLLCQIVYGKNEKYREGMVFGVHIPEDAMNQACVQKICRKNHKRWKIFFWCSLILAGLISLATFAGMEMFLVLLIWVIWVFLYTAAVYVLIQIPHREMYRLKLEKGWIHEPSRHSVYIDTNLSKESGHMALSWRWHLLFLLVTLCAGIWLMQTFHWRMADNVGWILLVVTLFDGVLFLVLHLWIVDRRNVVYSRSSEVNLAVNRAVKRAWSLGFLAAAGMNSIAWIYMAVQLAGNNWVNTEAYMVYAFLQCMAAVLLILPLLPLAERKRKLLYQNAETIEVDDDEYWQHGWYSNPHDPKLLVQDRLNSMNYSFNMAHRSARIITGALMVLTVGVLVWISGLMLQLQNAEVTFTMEGTKAETAAAGYSCSFDTRDIEAVELIAGLPDERFVRTNGASTDKCSFGHFRGKETGKCMMFLFKGYEPVLKITLPEQTVYVNSKDSAKTRQWYEALELAWAANRR